MADQDVSSFVNEMRAYSAARPNPVAIRMDELRERVERKGGTLSAAPLEFLERRLDMLSIAQREYVMRQLSQGQPAVVYRDPQPGEPRAKVPVAFVLVSMPGAGSVQQNRPSAPPQPTSGLTPVEAILRRERQRAGLRFGKYAQGSNDQPSIREQATTEIARAFAQRSTPDPVQGERIVGAQVVGSSGPMQRMNVSSWGLRPAGLTRLANREATTAAMYAYNAGGA